MGFMVNLSLRSLKPLLTADWIVAVTIGMINKVPSDPLRGHGNEDLYVLWASFLLLHLGGPDTITSFALEDNEFWLGSFHSRDTLTLEKIYDALFSKEKMKQLVVGSKTQPEGLVIRVDKDKFGGFEVSLTYALLIGAMGVDTISDRNGIKQLHRRKKKGKKNVQDDFRLSVYHLMMKPEMLAPILKGNWQLAFQDTFEETKEHLMNHQISDHIKACNEFMNVEGKLKLKV
ncbi:hypothetical protein FEM48_Zijuj11G0137500 [Ziziphus jujuba var. spinosa]|uniref:DUF4220 domain-containing protein n=1 Tax=Ziziphus jujuba var. spinosa TaxID=714518 RepID=A0A978UJA1_ZIZJJ|nr:hypothetical protein FEM48_Zijuj11G0137500 [Ziziphus jujuba var. spinosa]